MPEFNKLQLRAKVFDIIKSYTSEDDFVSALHTQNINELNNIGDKQFICEILLKELLSAKDFELDVVKNILADFATLELAEELIWKFLQDANISDSKKELCLQLLRALGGKVDVEMLMNCMQDFNSVVDEQTLGLLELATVNPEAQIDFMDFLISLKPQEQLQLINSLNEDFNGDELANIFTPALRINISQDVKKEIISLLGTTKSYLSIKPLKDFLAANTDDNLKSVALKALNQLKDCGIDIDDENLVNIREIEICKASKFYKAYLSQVDGCGNQGLIFSRITPDEKIIVFSAVVNITGGIMDCFGFYSISINDFRKIISRFKTNDFVVPISAQVAKYKLQLAEKQNSLIGTEIPYEYSCWKIYTCDIEPELINYNELLREKIEDFNFDTYLSFYDTEIFDSWFFEYDDNREVQNIINYLVSIKDNDTDYIFNNLEDKIEDNYYAIFTSAKIEEYSSMLLETAYIFYLNYDYQKANIAINLANAIKNDEQKFLKDIIRRSILQYLANIVSQETEKSSDNINIFLERKEKNTLSPQEAFSLLQKLEEQWDNMHE